MQVEARKMDCRREALCIRENPDHEVSMTVIYYNEAVFIKEHIIRLRTFISIEILSKHLDKH